MFLYFFFFFSSRRRHTRLQGDWSSDVCSSDLTDHLPGPQRELELHLPRILTGDQTVKPGQLRPGQLRRPARHRLRGQRIFPALAVFRQPPVHRLAVQPQRRGHILRMRAFPDLIHRPDPQYLKRLVVKLPAIVFAHIPYIAAHKIKVELLSNFLVSLSVANAVEGCDPSTDMSVGRSQPRATASSPLADSSSWVTGARLPGNPGIPRCRHAWCPVPPIRFCPLRSGALPTCRQGHLPVRTRILIRRARPACAAVAGAGRRHGPRSADRYPLPPGVTPARALRCGHVGLRCRPVPRPVGPPSPQDEPAAKRPAPSA